MRLVISHKPWPAHMVLMLDPDGRELRSLSVDAVSSGNPLLLPADGHEMLVGHPAVLHDGLDADENRRPGARLVLRVEDDVRAVHTVALDDQLVALLPLPGDPVDVLGLGEDADDIASLELARLLHRLLLALPDERLRGVELVHPVDVLTALKFLLRHDAPPVGLFDRGKPCIGVFTRKKVRNAALRAHPGAVFRM